MATILCDLDGTLLVKRRPDPPGVVSPKRAAINRALAKICDAPAVDFVQGMEHGFTDWMIAERAVRVHRPGFDLDGPTWQAVVARAEAVFAPGPPVPPGGAGIYRRLDGVPEVLHALRDAGHRLGLVTGNVSFFALYKLREAGIDRALFDGPAAFSDHGRERAHILRTALARDAGGPAVVLGDTVHDRAGAAAVGLPFLGTGAMGLRRDQVELADGARAAWLPDLGDPARVVATVAGLL
jgi:phosphoglycolate phosphatase-like HAD superfamily hydrolase